MTNRTKIAIIAAVGEIVARKITVADAIDLNDMRNWTRETMQAFIKEYDDQLKVKWLWE